MKLIGCYTVLNEHDYFETSFRSMIPVVDEVVVVHGSTKFAPLTRAGFSVDDTETIFDRLSKEFPGKLRVIELGQVRERCELQNTFVDAVPEGNFVLFSGADEIWDTEELARTREKYLGSDHYVELYVKQMELRHDWSHRLPIEIQKDSIFYDETGAVFSNGFIQERIYQRIKKLDVRYRNENHTHVKDDAGRALYAHKYYEKRRLGIPLRFWHVPRFCSIDKFRLKFVHIRLQNHYGRTWAELTNKEREFEIEAADNMYNMTLRIPEKRAELLADFKEKEIPKLLRDHEFFGKKVGEFPRNLTYAVSAVASSDA